IPWLKSTTSLEKFARYFFLTGFILGPGISPCFTCVVPIGGMWLLLPAFRREEAREHKYGFNTKSFEGAEIGFDARS
ncbi:hypothetical protein EDC04DRAFT_2578359, partial [Pisolithus marmoratus]